MAPVDELEAANKKLNELENRENELQERLYKLLGGKNPNPNAINQVQSQLNNIKYEELKVRAQIRQIQRQNPPEIERRQQAQEANLSNYAMGQSGEMFRKAEEANRKEDETRKKAEREKEEASIAAIAAAAALKSSVVKTSGKVIGITILVLVIFSIAAGFVTWSCTSNFISLPGQQSFCPAIRSGLVAANSWINYYLICAPQHLQLVTQPGGIDAVCKQVATSVPYQPLFTYKATTSALTPATLGFFTATLQINLNKVTDQNSLTGYPEVKNFFAQPLLFNSSDVQDTRFEIQPVGVTNSIGEGFATCIACNQAPPSMNQLVCQPSIAIIQSSTPTSRANAYCSFGTQFSTDYLTKTLTVSFTNNPATSGLSANNICFKSSGQDQFSPEFQISYDYDAVSPSTSIAVALSQGQQVNLPQDTSTQIGPVSVKVRFDQNIYAPLQQLSTNMPAPGQPTQYIQGVMYIDFINSGNGVAIISALNIKQTYDTTAFPSGGMAYVKCGSKDNPQSLVNGANLQILSQQPQEIACVVNFPQAVSSSNIFTFTPTFTYTYQEILHTSPPTVTMDYKGCPPTSSTSG